jgi:hypothetical protein
MSSLEMYDMDSNHKAFIETSSDATGFSGELNANEIYFQNNPALFTKEGVNPLSYPLIGAADHETFCEAKLVAAGLDKDWKVEVATDRTIQLDFDIPFEQMLPKQFFDALEIFARMLDETKTASWRHLKSRSGRSHVIIDLSWDMPQSERIAWQSVFGSDFKREALSLAYAALGQRSPVLLYSLKSEVSLYVPILPRVDEGRIQ